MRGQTRSSEKDRAAIRQRRVDRAAQSKLNRAQLRAMEIRAAETVAPEPGDIATASIDAGAAGVAALQPRRVVATSKRVVARPIVLTKDQEYRFIRSDLNRLGMTAGLLFVLMVVLLIVVEA